MTRLPNPSASEKKCPAPRLNVGRGRCTDLVFPTLGNETRNEVVPNA